VAEPELIDSLRGSRCSALFQLGNPRVAFVSWELARGAQGASMNPYEHSQLGGAKLFAGDIDGTELSANIAIAGPDTPGHGIRVARAIRAWVSAIGGDMPRALEETEIALSEALTADEPDRLPHDVPQLCRAVVLDGAGAARKPSSCSAAGSRTSPTWAPPRLRCCVKPAPGRCSTGWDVGTKPLRKRMRA